MDSKVISWALQLPRALRWAKRAEEKGGSTAVPQTEQSCYLPPAAPRVVPTSSFLSISKQEIGQMQHWTGAAAENDSKSLGPGMLLTDRTGRGARGDNG